VIYLLYFIHIVVCLFLILVVLVQQGKGADLSVFGGGTTMAAFGARSATNLLHRLTVGGFIAFILTTVGIAYVQGHTSHASLLKGATAPASAPATPGKSAPAAPAAPAPASPAPSPASPSPK